MPGLGWPPAALRPERCPTWRASYQGPQRQASGRLLAGILVSPIAGSASASGTGAAIAQIGSGSGAVNAIGAVSALVPAWSVFAVQAIGVAASLYSQVVGSGIAIGVGASLRGNVGGVLTPVMAVGVGAAVGYAIITAAPPGSATVMGATSSHGGTIISSSPNATANGTDLALVGNMHSCPIPGHGITPIVSLFTAITLNGVPIARVGDQAACGAVILTGIPSITT